MFPISLGAVRLEKISEAASFSLSLAPGWGARGSQEIPKWAEHLWEHIFQVQEEMVAHPTWILPTCERPHPFQVHFLSSSPRSWEVKLPGS